MTMRWVHTWKVAEDTGETQAKARLVVRGFTDPDLTEIRAESPRLSGLSRQLILQIAASRGFRLRRGDVKSKTRCVRRAPTRVPLQDADLARTSAEIGYCCVWSWKRAESMVETSCS